MSRRYKSTGCHPAQARQARHAKEVLNDPSRLYSHFNIPSQSYLPQILSKEKFKLLYPMKLKQHDLDQYELVDQFKLKDKANND